MPLSAIEHSVALAPDAAGFSRRYSLVTFKRTARRALADNDGRLVVLIVWHQAEPVTTQVKRIPSSTSTDLPRCVIPLRWLSP